MHWILWILLANISIAVIEYFYRIGRFETFWQALPFLIVPIIMGQIGLFYGFRAGGASTLIHAGIVFTLMNLLFRLANTWLVGEVITSNTIIAIILTGVAAFITM